jgi:hypothetical protein
MSNVSCMESIHLTPLYVFNFKWISYKDYGVITTERTFDVG